MDSNQIGNCVCRLLSPEWKNSRSKLD